MAIKKLNEANLELILSWRNNPIVRNAMVSQNIISLTEHLQWFENIRYSDDKSWFVYEDSNSQPCGVVYLSSIDKKKKKGLWGFYKAPYSLSGTGFQMGREALNYFFHKLDLNSIYGEVRKENLKSINFHKKLGFYLLDKKEVAKLKFDFSTNTLKFKVAKEHWNIF